ncbi:Transmembrane protein 94 [Liparis tanakae]|uniref:Transmembrane protein 94 n=1 Tax=Liparis tanakae TaxID=230148 RepID=A0A4Z2GCB8_9TELE|nr:Transmembrane protein 94 [Liparis tanakae]
MVLRIGEGCFFRKKGSEEEAVALGLSTGQALAKLRDQLSSLLEQHQKPERRRASAQERWVNSFLYHGNRHSCLHWPGAALTLLVVLGLLCCHGSQPRGSSGIELMNAAALLLLFLLNLLLVGRQERLKSSEMVRRLNAIIAQLSDYLSGCVGEDDEHIVLEPGDLFPPFSPPPSPRANEKRGPQSPQQHRLFRVVRTPVLDIVRNSLELALARPITVLDNERFTVQLVITKLVCPVVLAAFLVVNTVRYFCDAPSLTPPCYNFFQLQLMGVLPILPLLFPVMWV